MPLAALLVGLPLSLALGAPVAKRLEVGTSLLKVGDPPWQPGSLTYEVDGTRVVAGVTTFGASTDWKEHLLDFAGSTVTTRDSFGRRQVLMRRDLPDGWAEQEAVLGANSLELCWRFELSEFTGNLEINVFFPDASLGVAPYEAVFQDGTTQRDQLWVEPRAALTDLHRLTVDTAQRRLVVDVGKRRGWQFQDLRRTEQHHGLYRMVLPIYNVKGAYREEITLRVSVNPPAPELFPLNLSSVANMGLADEYEGDGRGGWTDQGDNDLRTLPTGILYLKGLPFEVLSPQEHDGRAVVMLRGELRPYFAETAWVPVGRKVGALYLLHGTAWATPGRIAFSFAVTYEDGETLTEPVRVGEGTCDWWGAQDLGGNAQVAWRCANARAPVGLMVLRWVNPRPDEPVRGVTLRAGDGPVVGVVAITGASAPLPLATQLRSQGKLPALRVAGCGQTGLDTVFRGTRLEPDFHVADIQSLEDLTPFDLLVVAAELPPAKAEQIAERVRKGGRLLVFGPPPAALREMLPVSAAGEPVLRVIAPYWRWNEGEPRAFFLRPEDPAGPLFSGLDPTQFPPVGAFYELAAAPDAAVEARWVSDDGQEFPAIVARALGQGRVTYFNIPRFYPASGGTDYLSIFLAVNRYRDPFFLKLAYHAAGRDDVAELIGRVFEAKALREQLLSPMSSLRVRLENLRALAGYLGRAETGDPVVSAGASLEAVYEEVDRGDELVEGLLGEEALASYRRAAALVAQAEAQYAAVEAALQSEVDTTNSGGVTPTAVAVGPPLWVGSTHVNQGLVYPSGPSRKWVYDWALERMSRELGWNVFDIGVGGYGAAELWPDRKELRPDALDDIAQAAADNGMAMILCTVSGAFGRDTSLVPYTKAANQARAEVLRAIGRHFSLLPACYAFEPNNEPGMGATPETAFGYNPQTMDQFRHWLVQRHGGLDGINAALGTAFGTLAEVAPRRPEEMRTIGPDDPRRMLWADWIQFRFDLMEEMHRSDYVALREVSAKPIFDRTAGDGMNWCGVPASGALIAARQDQRALYHDALGTHVVTPFLLDYQVGMSRGKRIVQSEYYWSTYGGPSDGLRYRFCGNFMHPYLENDNRNFAAVGRNFWKALSRGNDLYTIYFANPANMYGGYDEGYWGVHCVYWGDHSFKGMTYAMKVYPEEANRIRGELLGARHVAQVGLLEPRASIVHTLGTEISADIRDPQYEAEALHKALLADHVQTEIIGEWKLLEGDAPRPPPPTSALCEGIPPVLIVPYGLYLATAVQERLLGWVRDGGTLIATGPLGLYDEGGRSCARLLNAVFPDLRVARGDGATAHVGEPSGPPVRRRWTLTHAAVATRYDSGEGAVVLGEYGRGRVIVTGFPFLDAPEAVGALVSQEVAEHAPPLVTADNPSVQLYLVRRDAVHVLYAINEDHRADQPVTLTFSSPAVVTDLRCAVSLSPRTSLRVTLSAGEGRVYRVEGLR